MRRLVRVALVLSLVATLAVIAPVSAYYTLGCKWSTTSLKWRDASTGSYPTAAAASAAAWDATASPISFAKVTSGEHIDVYSTNYGNTGYDGITLDSLGRNPITYACSGGTWDAPIMLHWNTYYTDAYSTTMRKSVMVHEFGHALGLAH